MLLMLRHTAKIVLSYRQNVDYIEGLLRSQLIKAIGKEVQPSDLVGFLDNFHYRKIFRDIFEPVPFSYNIRRSKDHAPEGSLSIEAVISGESIRTFASAKARGAPMLFALNASTNVRFGGERFVHGWVRHKFSDQVDVAPPLVLHARARQFSSFIVLLGRIVAADRFEPKYAFIVRNKDEWLVPLDLETIPTPKVNLLYVAIEQLLSYLNYIFL